MSNEWDEPQDEFNATLVESRIPPEPPEGTWVIDRHGAVSQRRRDADGRLGWGMPGFYSFGVWEAMWTDRGPLVECSPWGITETAERREQERALIRTRLVHELNEADRAYAAAKARLEEFDLNLGPRQ